MTTDDPSAVWSCWRAAHQGRAKDRRHRPWEAAGTRRTSPTSSERAHLREVFVRINILVGGEGTCIWSGCSLGGRGSGAHLVLSVVLDASTSFMHPQKVCVVVEVLTAVLLWTFLPLSGVRQWLFSLSPEHTRTNISWTFF